MTPERSDGDNVLARECGKERLAVMKDVRCGKERLAVMKDVRCGVGDRGRAWLSFSTFISEAGAALQILEWDQAKEVLEAYGVEDVYELNGKVCWVDTSTPGMTHFVGPAKI